MVELEFGGGGASAWIRWWARRWELLVDTEVGFLAIIVGRRDIVWRIGNPVGMTCRRQIVWHVATRSLMSFFKNLIYCFVCCVAICRDMAEITPHLTSTTNLNYNVGGRDQARSKDTNLANEA